MICRRCRVICEGECPICGKRRLYEPESNEPVLLMVLTPMQAMLVEPILQDSGIPYSRSGTIGGALSLMGGMMLESCRFYVPYAALGKSREAITNVFGEDADIMHALNEFNPAQN